jgi:hypothetical protein
MKTLVIGNVTGYVTASRVEFSTRAGSVMSMTRNEAIMVAKWVLENVEPEKKEPPRQEITLEEAAKTDSLRR